MTFQVTWRVRLISEFVTSCFILPELNFFAGISTHDIQNLKICGKSNLKKEENQIFCFHKATVVDIVVKNDRLTFREYMFSLDESGVCGIWNTEKSKLGPIFVLNLNPLKATKIVTLLFPIHFHLQLFLITR